MSEFFGLYSHPSGVLLHCFVLGVACSISHARPPFSPRPISALMLQAALSLTMLFNPAAFGRSRHAYIGTALHGRMDGYSCACIIRLMHGMGNHRGLALPPPFFHDVPPGYADGTAGVMPGGIGRVESHSCCCRCVWA